MNGGDDTREQVQPGQKIGRCLVRDYKTGRACGCPSWYPSSEEEYICSRCLSPIAWTRKIRKQQGMQQVKPW